MLLLSIASLPTSLSTPWSSSVRFPLMLLLLLLSILSLLLLFLLSQLLFPLALALFPLSANSAALFFASSDWQQGHGISFPSAVFLTLLPLHSAQAGAFAPFVGRIKLGHSRFGRCPAPPQLPQAVSCLPQDES